MRTRYRIFEENAVYFVSSSIVDWIDIFNSEQYFEILINALNFKRKDSDLKLYAYVFMKNHFHLILSSINIIKFIKEYKSFTARKIISQLEYDNESDILQHFIQSKKSFKNESTYQIWQEGYHPELISNMEIFRQKVEYIHNNPVRKSYVANPVDWIYSSARNYLLDSGIMEIDSPV